MDANVVVVSKNPAAPDSDLFLNNNNSLIINNNDAAIDEAIDAIDAVQEQRGVVDNDAAAAAVGVDKRLLDAASAGQTDFVLQLLEEEGQQLHSFKDKVRTKLKYTFFYPRG